MERREGQSSGSLMKKELFEQEGMSGDVEGGEKKDTEDLWKRVVLCV